ncbi:rod shape-determining protein MreD [Myxococcota bacterium]|nr:rod shape-determining protein MreD [Myxococcota bacterium]MBU1537471.1 rod shape-determining protein MreD [Myxococcota bacterium]
MRVTVLFFLTVITFLIEPLLMEIIPYLGTAAPEFGIITIIYLAHSVKGSPARGAGVSLLLGYLMDLYSGAPVGMHAFVYVSLYFVLRLLSTKIYGHTIMVQALMGGIFSGLVGFIIIAIDKWLNPIPHSWDLLRVVPRQMIVTALFAPPWFWVLWRIDRAFFYEASPEGVFR